MRQEIFDQIVEDELYGHVSDPERDLLNSQLREWEESLIRKIEEFDRKIQRIQNDTEIKIAQFDGEPGFDHYIEMLGQLRDSQIPPISRRRSRAERRLNEVSLRLASTEADNQSLHLLLRRAIERHRSQHPAPSVEDEMLYAALEGRWVSE